MLLKEIIRHKKILILGFGREGRENFKYFRQKFPKKTLGVGDRLEFRNFDKGAQRLIKSDKNIRLYLGKDYLKAIKDYQVIVKSPGISPYLPEIRKAKREGKITSATEIFFENCPGEIIGVTGTKGKGTTGYLIHRILQAARLHSYFIGNIGKPSLRYLDSAEKSDVFIYELSSHQLYDLRRSPHIAILLNIYPDHLDYFQNFKEYIKAKQNITRYQTKDDYLLFNSADKIASKIAKSSKAKLIPFKGGDNPSSRVADILGKLFNIPPEIIAKEKRKLISLPHRLEFVGTYRGIQFYNDSASTIPESTIFALKKLGDKVQTLILGGSEKRLSFKKLIQELPKTKVKNLILFPTTGSKIWKNIKKKSPKRFKGLFASNMREAVEFSFLHTKSGKICLLSPASASFSLFKNYQERGKLFKKYIKEYGKRKIS